MEVGKDKYRLEFMIISHRKRWNRRQRFIS